MKILVCVPENEGVSKYRFIDPLVALQREHPNEFTIDLVYNIPSDITKLLHYSHIVFPVNILLNEAVKNLFLQLQSSGCTLIGDIDDYWELHQTHPYYELAKNGISQLVPQVLKIPNIVTTTTVYLADKISPFNKNVVVIPNCVDFKTFKRKIAKPNPYRKTIGWAGGSSHLNDLQTLSGVVNYFQDSPDLQWVMCGFDDSVRDAKTGKISKMKFPTMSISDMRNIANTPISFVWVECEKIFTNKYNTISDEYLAYLFSFTKDEYSEIEKMPYRRVWSAHKSKYNDVYASFDIALAPLANTTFNKMKSELKILESGAYALPTIVSNIEPYSAAINAGVVWAANDEKDWIKAIKVLSKDKTLREDLGSKLHEHIVKNHNMIDSVKVRREIFLR